MGQYQETMRVTGGALRRMILVLALAAVMAAMTVASAMPAKAGQTNNENGAVTVLPCSGNGEDLKGNIILKGPNQVETPHCNLPGPGRRT
jgi:hypothetical protein